MEINLEEKTLNDLKEGNLSAFDRVSNNLERPLFAYVYGLVGHRQDTEDIIQDTFIKIFKNRHLINPKGNFKSWVYKIASNTAFDFLRAKNRKVEILMPASTEDDEDNQEISLETIEDPSAYYLSELDTARALTKIKPIHRTVLLLFYYQGFKYEEIASILSAPINTVKTLIYRAKKELKEYVQ